MHTIIESTVTAIILKLCAVVPLLCTLFMYVVKNRSILYECLLYQLMCLSAFSRDETNVEKIFETLSFFAAMNSLNCKRRKQFYYSIPIFIVGTVGKYISISIIFIIDN